MEVYKNNCGNCEHCDCGAKEESGQQAGQSLWAATAEAPAYPRLTGDLTADVAVVGGGITGLTTAYLLQKAGKKVVVIEAAQLGQGVTGYTSAHVTVTLDVRYAELIRKFGITKAKLVYQTSQTALDFIRQTVTDLSIECDYASVPGYLYSDTKEDVADLTKELAAAKQLGIDVSWADSAPLPFPTYGTVVFANQAQFHPLKYIQGLAKAFTAAGGQIFEKTRVEDVSKGHVKTDRGTITVQDSILATHTPILTKLLPVQAKLSQYRSYVLSATLKNDQIPVGLFWDTHTPYNYIRSYGDQIVVGGQDHHVGELLDTKKYIAKLECYVQEKFPIAAINHVWSAQYFKPCDDLPYIGQAPLLAHVYVATGFIGNGLTLGTASALLLSDLLLGKANVWAKLYNPNRITLSSLVQLTKFGWNNFKHFAIDRFTPGAKGGAVDLANNEGKVMTEGGKKVAVYKDRNGVVTKLSPVCTHAGCIVQWNQFEKTWDCPCHGGRYSAEGVVLNGPPVKDLARL